MAVPGARAKPAALRLVDGTSAPGRHDKSEVARAKVAASGKSFGLITPPSTLSGEALVAWHRYIKPAWWLDASKEPIAIAFCEVWKEFRADPQKFSASRHAQMRAYLSELGLTDERNRSAPPPEKSDEFFDD